MAVAHPDARLARGRGEDLFVQPERFVELADPAQRGGLQVGPALMVGLFCGDLVQLGNRLFGTVLAVEHQGQIGPRGSERRRQIERAAQQVFAILVTPDPPGQFGEQPDRRDVERELLQLRAQQRLGARQIIGVHRQRGLDQPGVVLTEPREPAASGDGCHGVSLA